MKTQNEMRSEFEKLEEIADKLEHLFFEDGFYFRKYDDADSDEYFVNGAWYAFKEKQKEIDQLMEVLASSFRIEKSLYGQVVALKSQVDILEKFLK